MPSGKPALGRSGAPRGQSTAEAANRVQRMSAQEILVEELPGTPSLIGEVTLTSGAAARLRGRQAGDPAPGGLGALAEAAAGYARRGRRRQWAA